MSHGGADHGRSVITGLRRPQEPVTIEARILRFEVSSQPLLEAGRCLLLAQDFGDGDEVPLGDLAEIAGGRSCTLILEGADSAAVLAVAVRGGEPTARCRRPGAGRVGPGGLAAGRQAFVVG